MRAEQPTLALLARQSASAFGNRPLLVNPPGPEAARQLDPLGSGHSVYLQWPDFQRHGQANTATLGLESVPTGEFDQAIVFLARQRRLTDCLLAFAAAALPGNRPIWLLGENRAGIKASGKRLAEVADGTKKLDGARHCSLFAATNRVGNGFELDAWLDSKSYPTPGGSLDLQRLPGVFGKEGLDAGTALLLEALPALDGDILDVGCGCGVISLWLKRQNPQARITGLDADSLAVASARHNSRELGLDVNWICGDVYPDSDQRFDHIVSNPPFHQGVATELAIGQRLIAQAPQRLNPGGSLWLVCNRFLPWRQQMQQAFGAVETLAENGRFAVYRAQKS